MNTTFNAEKQNALAERFHALHHAETMLVLPNAWDCLSAKIFEESGFPAIATTSSGISWSVGYKDGEHIPPELMLEVIRRITNAVSIPVTADIEAGYFGNDFERYGKFISDVIEAGAVGVNIEDADAKTKTLNDLDKQKTKITLAKNIGKEKGVRLFVNARTDAYERAPGELKNKIHACIERADAYQRAGADGIFIPFILEMETIAELKKAVPLPLNILVNEKLDIGGLRKLQINRVTVGGKPIVAAMSLLKKISAELQSGNNWQSLFVKEPTYLEINSWFQ